MIVLTVTLGLLATVLLLPTLSDMGSIVRVVLRRRPAARTPTTQPRFLFLVPAHNEEPVLSECLESLRRLRYPADRMDVVVVADNCSDRTADIARVAGVRCLSRTAPEQPGKPRAISWALSRLAVSDYDGVVIVDADTEVDEQFAARLAEAAPLADQALQPYNGVANRSQNALTRMSAVLSSSTHGLAYVLKTRARLNVPLSVGMCLGARVLSAHGWTAFSLCEDWELYASLTARGVRIRGVPAARIYAQEAPTLKMSASQRRRWTAGKLTVLVKYAWPLLRSPNVGFAQKLDSLAELSMPGPVVHLTLAALAASAALVVAPPGSQWLTAALLATLVRPIAYTAAALVRDPEPIKALRAFAFLPLYAGWRVGPALGALGMLGENPWVRTGRWSRVDLNPRNRARK